MPEPLTTALDRVRQHLLDPESLVRAVASGRRRGEHPAWRRVELRYVDLKAGLHLQTTGYDQTQAHTTNHAAGTDAGAAVTALLAEPFGNWHVETRTEVHQLRVTKRGEAAVHSRANTGNAATRSHDRDKARLLPTGDPVLRELGIADHEGRIKPSRQAKHRQVEEFLRQLDAVLNDAAQAGVLREPDPADPLRIVDLGCGNAYLTFAAERFLTTVRGFPVTMLGVDVKQQSLDHNTAVAQRVGSAAGFRMGTIADVRLDPPPELVLALHACDTATDEALARAVEWDAAVVLAAPCCHHDLASQLRSNGAPAAYDLLVRDGILRERFADTLTDGLRAALLRDRGYRVDVVEFVGSEHTPRNTLLRAVRTGHRAGRVDYDRLVVDWGVTPHLQTLLDRAEPDA